MCCRHQLASVWISVVGAVISSRGGFSRVPLPLSAVVVVWISCGSGGWEPQSRGVSSGRSLGGGGSGGGALCGSGGGGAFRGGSSGRGRGGFSGGCCGCFCCGGRRSGGPGCCGGSRSCRGWSCSCCSGGCSCGCCCCGLSMDLLPWFSFYWCVYNCSTHRETQIIDMRFFTILSYLYC